MREILFRGKRLDNGEWVEGFYNHIPCGRFDRDEHMIQTIKENGKIGMLYDVEPSTVGQYTGLKDKNGKRIFEGDIVKFEYMGANIGLSATETVAFQDGMFGCFWGPNRSFIPLSGFVRYTFEVIGNIHDNPELIAEEQP